MARTFAHPDSGPTPRSTPAMVINPKRQLRTDGTFVGPAVGVLRDHAAALWLALLLAAVRSGAARAQVIALPRCA